MIKWDDHGEPCSTFGQWYDLEGREFTSNENIYWVHIDDIAGHAIDKGACEWSCVNLVTKQEIPIPGVEYFQWYGKELGTLVFPPGPLPAGPYSLKCKIVGTGGCAPLEDHWDVTVNLP